MYLPVIGLEVHAQLLTKSKMFCSCSTDHENAPPNTLVCPVCMGMPGVLPVVNKKAVELVLKTALALNCEIAPFSKFDRKNYFYPDLPKGYQISQYDLPLARRGYVEFEMDGEIKRVRLKRIHLEEDTGKLLHVGEGDRLAEAEYSLVDLNRCGIPLMEIVTEPDIHSAKEARLFLQELRNILRYLEVSSGDMEKGSLRCDANISIMVEKGVLGTRTEIKNVNSFYSLEKALEYEIERQINLLKEGKEVVQETRHWDEKRQITVTLRGKEEAEDYRYFPEPDIPPLIISNEILENIKRSITPLPLERKLYLQRTLSLTPQEAEIITSEKELCDFFDKCLKLYSNAKNLSNWITVELMSYLNDQKLNFKDLQIEPEEFIKIILMVDKNEITRAVGKEILRKYLETKESPDKIVEREGLKTLSDIDMIKDVVKKVIENNEKAVSDYRKGKKNVINFLVGQVMKETKGRASLDLVKNLLEEELNK
ncbi:MAG: Asp-tRNA(Asn)/Glu-tRNA(Gln) amidotransferase GatCAB subunit B [Dictyoglomus sp. NZ13-RE01]|nr:MAG: Asp-tRNA(Asn)/Glu-tRNA(Gln) amidotransferase GatCAB subunit B [Dictyoglomus sp. NZ13-RE01]